jgi:hypothetical protein
MKALIALQVCDVQPAVWVAWLTSGGGFAEVGNVKIPTIKGEGRAPGTPIRETNAI